MADINNNSSDFSSLMSNGSGSTLALNKQDFFAFCRLLDQIHTNLTECEKNADEYDYLLDEIPYNFYKRVEVGPLHLLKNGYTGRYDEIVKYRQTVEIMIDNAQWVLKELGWLDEYDVTFPDTSSTFDGTGLPPNPSNDQGAYPGGYVGPNPYVGIGDSNVADEAPSVLVPPVAAAVTDSWFTEQNPSSIVPNTGNTGSYPSTEPSPVGLPPTETGTITFPDEQEETLRNETAEYTNTVVDKLTTILGDLNTDDEGYTTAIVYTKTETGEMSATWVDLTNEDAISNVLNQISDKEVPWGTTVSIIAYGGITGATYIGELTSVKDENGNRLTDTVDYNYLVVDSQRPPEEQEEITAEEEHAESEEPPIIGGTDEVVESSPIIEEETETSAPEESEPIEDIEPNVTVTNVGPEAIEITPTGYTNNYQSYSMPIGDVGNVGYTEPVSEPTPEYVDPEANLNPVYTFESMEPTLTAPDMPTITLPDDANQMSNQGIESVNITPLSDITANEEKGEPMTNEYDMNGTPIGMGGIAFGASTATAYGVNKYRQDKKEDEEDKDKKDKE